jgi:hypothetical protein
VDKIASLFVFHLILLTCSNQGNMMGKAKEEEEEEEEEEAWARYKMPIKF